MADLGTLIMNIKADTDDFERGMERADTSASNTARNIAAASVAIVAAIGAIGTKTILMASDAEETKNKFDVVFSGMTEEVETWADSYSDSVGRSRFDTMEYLSNLADLQQGLGMTTEESFDLASQIVTLGTDLASFNNLQDADAIDALSKAMLGEAESAKTLGLLLNVERVKDYVEAQGLVYDSLTDAERAQQVFNLAVEQSQNAIGDAEATTDSFANQFKALKTNISDSATEFGLSLLPKATELITWINDSGIPGIGAFADSAKEMASDFTDKVTPAIEGVKNWFTENFPEMKTVASDTWDGIKTAAGTWVDYVSDTYGPAMEELGEWFTDKLPEWKEIAKENWDKIKEAVQPFVDIIVVDLMPILDDVRIWFIESIPTFAETVGTQFTKIIDKIVEISDTFDETIGGTMKEELEEFRDVWPEISEGTTIAINAIIASIGDLAVITGDSIEGSMMVLNDFMEKWRLLNSIVHGFFGLAKTDGKSFKEKMEEYMEDVGGFIFALRDNFGTTGEVIFDFFADLGQKGAEALEDISTAINNTIESWQNLVQLMTPGGNLFGQIKDMYDSATSSTGPVTGDTANDPMAPTYNAPTTIAPSPNAYPEIRGQLADGGSVMAGRSYLVGEKRPEVFVPSSNGSIVPLSSNITINVNGSGNPEVTANKIVEILKRQGVRVA